MVLLDIPFAEPLALFVAITDLIPNIGATIGARGAPARPACRAGHAVGSPV